MAVIYLTVVALEDLCAIMSFARHTGSVRNHIIRTTYTYTADSNLQLFYTRSVKNKGSVFLLYV